MDNKIDGKRENQVLTKEKFDFKTWVQPSNREFQVVGKSIHRTDAVLKVSGKQEYGADYPEEGFLKGKILRSPYPHALIKSIKVEKAKDLPGVAAVLTAADVPGRNGFGAILPDQPVICGEKVRFIGDGVALVAAETEKIAQQALELIEVEYEPLPAVFDPREAMKEGAPLIHEKGNLLSYNKLRKGDVDQGFSQADAVIERTYQVPFLEHAYMEPDIVMAVPQSRWDHAGGRTHAGPFHGPTEYSGRPGSADQPSSGPSDPHGRRLRRQRGFPDRPGLSGRRAGFSYRPSGADGPGTGGGHPPDLQASSHDHGDQDRGQEGWDPGGFPGGDL